MAADRASEDDAVGRALSASYTPPRIREARERQDEILIARFRGEPLRIADIGCGDGYHGAIFGPSCEQYHGFEIAPELAAASETRWREAGLVNASVYLGDVVDAELPAGFYDLAWCLYFTPGNIREPSDDLGIYTDAYLDENPRFIEIFTRVLRSLKPEGRLFLTVYKDVPEAEAAQLDFYDRTGLEVVTPKGSRFVSTAEGFWSARWTEASLRSNLGACGAEPSRVELHDLNSIAWLVEVTAVNLPG